MLLIEGHLKQKNDMKKYLKEDIIILFYFLNLLYYVIAAASFL